jgi:hypothetical protein
MNVPVEPNTLYTVAEIVAITKYSRKTIYKAIATEHLKAERPDDVSEYRVWGQAVLDWLHGNGNHATPDE